MKLLITLLLFGFASCKQERSDKKQVYDPRAIQLNDSATIISESQKDEDIRKAILLLDQATTIDSNYFIAFWNKLQFEIQLKEYNRALQTAKRIDRLYHGEPYYHFITGICYERIGDTTSAKEYYENALMLFDKILDTIDTKNKHYNWIAMNKGIDLILLNRQHEGNVILTQLYNQQTDTVWKMAIEPYMNKTREEIIYGVDE